MHVGRTLICVCGEGGGGGGFCTKMTPIGKINSHTCIVGRTIV